MFTEIAASIGLLTPLVIGLLAFLEKILNRKYDSQVVSREDQPDVVQGMTVSVDYAAELVAEIRKDLADVMAERDAKQKENERLQGQLDVYRQQQLDRRE